MIHLQRILFFIVLILGITISVIGFMLLSTPAQLRAENGQVWEPCGKGFIILCGHDWPFTLGYSFTPQVNGEITKLCGYFSGTKTVRLFDSSYSVLASVNILSANSWSCSDISSVSVSSGSTYYVVVDVDSLDGCYNGLLRDLPSTCGDVLINSCVYQSPSGDFDAAHGELFDYMYGMVDVVFGPALSVVACEDHNVWGWAWAGAPQSSGGEKLGMGWLSFSCKNLDTGTDYGVDIEADGNLTGYAYYDGMNDPNTAEHEAGWIDFDSPGPYPSPPDYSAQVDLNGEISGWARAVGYGGDWDGWIKLRNDDPSEPMDYGVSIDSSSLFNGWAWGGNVMGWISFNCDNPESSDSCASTNNYHVETSLSFHNPPQVTSFRKTTSPNYCLNSPSQGLAWDYTGDAPQQAYKIEFRYQGGSVFKTIERSNSFNTSGIGIVTSPDINQLEVGYNDNYQFKVSVYDGNNWSEWSNVVNFSATDHPWPDVSFNYDPLEPTADEVVMFTDTSTVYGGAFKSSILWDFDGGNPATASGAVATTTFSAGDNRIITLIVTDSDTFVCDRELSLDINYPMPGWIEE